MIISATTIYSALFTNNKSSVAGNSLCGDLSIGMLFRPHEGLRSQDIKSHLKTVCTPVRYPRILQCLPCTALFLSLSLSLWLYYTVPSIDEHNEPTPIATKCNPSVETAADFPTNPLHGGLFSALYYWLCHIFI